MKTYKEYWEIVVFRYWASFAVAPKCFWRFVICGRADSDGFEGASRWANFRCIFLNMKNAFLPILWNILLAVICLIWIHYLNNWRFYIGLLANIILGIAAIYFGFIKS